MQTKDVDKEWHGSELTVGQHVMGRESNASPKSNGWPRVVSCDMIYRSAISMTFNSYFKDTPLFDVEYLSNNTRHARGYYGLHPPSRSFQRFCLTIK